MKEDEITLLNHTLKLDLSGHLSTTIVTQGGLDRDMNCEYRHFVWEGKYFQWSYEQTTLQVNILQIPASYDQRMDQVVLVAGIRGRFSLGFLHDNRLGTAVGERRKAWC